MTIKVGDRFPNVEVGRMGENGPEKVKTDDLFKGRRVVLFSVPGAFTPTCSKAHLPGFVVNADNLRDKGIDLIACVAVNDAFVMDAWGRASHVGDDIKLGLGRMTNMLASVPNFDYRAEGVPLTDLKIVDVPALDLLVVNAGNIDRNNDAIKQSIKNNQEWIKRTLEANPGLEAVGPVRIITTDFGAEKYAFDVAQPVRRKVAQAPQAPLAGEVKEDTDTPAENVAVDVAAQGEPLKVTIPGGAPVEYVRTQPRRAAFAAYTGYMAELDAARNSLRAWALTHGYEVTDRPYELWKAGVEKSFTAEGEYDIYWAIK